MLFKLSKELKDKIKNKNFNDNIKCLLERISTMIKTGKNLFYTERKIINIILNSNEIESYVQNIYRSYKNNLTEIGGILQMFKIQAIITNSEDNINKKSVKNTIYYMIPIKMINDYRFVNETGLIMEDFNDIDFFVKFIDIIKRSRNLDNLNIKYEKFNGGGDRTEKTLQNKVERKDRFIYCLVDSDKKFPNDKVSETARKVIKQKDDLKSNNFYHFYVNILKCHEIENLIPKYFVYEIYGEDENYKILVNKYDKLIFNCYKYRRYFDFKKGITLKLLKKEIENNSNFWQKALNLLNIDFEISNDRNEVTYLKGLNNFLRRTNQYIKNKNLCFEEIECDKNVENHWNKLADTFISYCCATKKIRS